MKNFRWDKKYLYWGVTAFCVVIASIVFFMSLQYWPSIVRMLTLLLEVVNPLIWGLVIAYLINPVMRFCEEKLFIPLSVRIVKNADKRHSLSRISAIVLSLLIAGFAIWELIWMVLPEVYSSLAMLANNLPDYVKQGIGWLEGLLIEYPEIEEIVISLVGDVYQTLTDWLSSELLPQFQNIITSLSTGVFTFIRIITDLIIGIIFSFYILFRKELFGAQTKKTLYSILPEKQVEGLLSAAYFTDNAFSGFIFGKILASLFIGIVCYIGCALLKIPYAALVSVVVGITNIIPFFGPFIGAVPCAVIILMVSPAKCLIFIIYVTVLQQLEGNIIGPRIISSAIGLSGFWVMFAITVGGGLFGFIGMMCGVPLFSVLYTGIRGLINNRLIKRGFSDDTELYMKKQTVYGDAGDEENEEEAEENQEP